MSRADYSDDLDNWSLICWRGAVNSAIRGKRGQQFLRELRDALDAMPEKRLIENSFQEGSGEVCALGCVGVARGLDMSSLDVEDSTHVGDVFGIADAMAREIMFINDDEFSYGRTPERRFAIVREWVEENIQAQQSGEPLGAWKCTKI